MEGQGGQLGAPHGAHPALPAHEVQDGARDDGGLEVLVGDVEDAAGGEGGDLGLDVRLQGGRLHVLQHQRAALVRGEGGSQHHVGGQKCGGCAS